MKRVPLLRLATLGILAFLITSVPAALAPGQEPTARGPDRRQDYAALLALPARERERIKNLVGDLNEEDVETQARLLSVMWRYVAWLDRLNPADRQYVEQAATPAERLERIRMLREKQWLATLTPAEREGLEGVAQRSARMHASQAMLWSAARALLPLPTPLVPLPPLEERQRLLAGFKQRERQQELEKQFALTQEPKRREDMQKEIQRLRRELKAKRLTDEEKRQVDAFPPDDMLAYIRTILDLARKYEVPMPEMKRQPILGAGLPRVPPDKLMDFARAHFSDSMLKEFEQRLKEQKFRPQALAELTALYWNAHPQELREFREQERKKKLKATKADGAQNKKPGGL